MGQASAQLLVLALHTLIRAEPQENDLERSIRWACRSVGEQLYAEAGSPPFKEYSYVREPMEAIAHFAPECDGSGLCSSVRSRLVKAFQLWDASRDNADTTQALVHAAFDEAVGTLGLRNFLRLVRDANALSTSLTCSQSVSRCRSVKERDPLNANLRLNMHVFGRHCAEAHSEGKLSMLSRAALVHEFVGAPDVVQGLHGSVWTFTTGLLTEFAEHHPMWHKGGAQLTGRTTSGAATELTAVATAIVGNLTQELCGQLGLLKAFHCVHGVGHAASYVALLVLDREQDGGKKLRSAQELPQAMTRGATVCAAASAAISELPRFERSKAMFEWGCSAGVWMVTYLHQSRGGSLVHEAMLRWKGQSANRSVATQPLAPPAFELAGAAQRVGPCALEPMKNYPQYCFAWWFSPSLDGEVPRTPQDLTADDCLLVGMAGSPDAGAGCAFAMANRYQQTMRPTSGSGHLARCEGYRGSQGKSAAGLKLKRRLWLACLAGLTMHNVESAIAGLRQLRAASFAASCAEFASDPVAMGACLSPALIPSGSSDCLTSILGFSLGSKGDLANTMASPNGFEQYEAARDAQCNWSAPQRADALTAPAKPRVGYHGTTPATFTALVRDQWRQASMDVARDRAIVPPLLGRRCALPHLHTFIFRLGPFDLAPAQSVLFSFDWPFGMEEAHAAAAGGGYKASFFGVVDRLGIPLGSPPLHVHHAMTWRGPLPMPELLSSFLPYRTHVDTHFIGGASDRQCQSVEGGPRCSFQELPTGTSLPWFAASTPVIEGILINEGTTPLTNISIEMAVRVASASVAEPALRHVVQLTFMLDMPKNSTFGTFPAPRGQSIHFTSWRMPFDGRVEASDFHTHGKMSPLKEAWIVAASAATLGLERAGAGFERGDPSQPIPLASLRLDAKPSAPVSLSVVQGYLRNNLLTARTSERERILCVISTEAEGAAARMPRQHAADGQPPSCATWRFLAGDHVTIVAFMDADTDGAPVHAQWYPVVSFDNSNVLV